MTIVEAPLIACTLAPGKFKDRLAWIAALNKDALRKYERRGLVLELNYAPEARERVHEMVRNEQACCAFLAFELHEAGNEIRLTVTAPERAREAADTLFEQFVANAPALSSRACAPSASVVKTPSKEPPGSKAAGVMAATLSTGAVACGVCCVLPSALPATVLASIGAFVGVVRQHAFVDHHPCHPLGRRRMGLDCVADAPHEPQASHINALHDGGGDSVIDGRSVMAAA